MSAIVAHWPLLGRTRDRTRHANAHFGLRVARPWLAMAAGVGFIIVVLVVFLGLGLWYVPKV